MNPQDQFVHIWRYEGGYKAIDENMKFLQDNKDYNLIMKDMSPLLRSRESELYLQFSFWPEVALRSTLVNKDPIMTTFHLLSKYPSMIQTPIVSGRDLMCTSCGHII